jgi:hypothetical protein
MWCDTCNVASILQPRGGGKGRSCRCQTRALTLLSNDPVLRTTVATLFLCKMINAKASTVVHTYKSRYPRGSIELKNSKPRTGM